MLYEWLADSVLGVHAAFVVFVVLGGLLVLRWPRLAWIHGPAVAWGVFIECAGLACPLTPLEIAFRRQAGEAGYEGGFIQHYVRSAIYPPGLTRAVQVGLAIVIFVVNAAIYWRLLGRHHRRLRDPAGHQDDPA